MASIRERKCSDGSITYHVSIRIKDQEEIHKGFKDKETAELYAWYKENLIKEMKNFEVPMQEMVTLRDGFELKIKLAEGEGKTPKYIRDCKADFSHILTYMDEDIYLKDITPEMIEELCEKLANSVVFKGGSQYNIKLGKRTGKPVQISGKTLYRRMLTLSTIFNLCNQELNANLINPVALYMPAFRSKYLK